MRADDNGQKTVVCSSSYSDYGESDKRRAREASRHIEQARESLRLARHYLNDEEKFVFETNVIKLADIDLFALRASLTIVGNNASDN